MPQPPQTPKARRCASHLPVLRAYLSAWSEPILEFGAGRWSTPLLSGYCPGLVSLERNAAWASEIQRAAPEAILTAIPGDRAAFCQLFGSLITADHAVFVDGAPNTWRAAALSIALDQSVAIAIAHDWPQKSYDYHLVTVPPAYRTLVYACNLTRVRTAVFLCGARWPDPLPTPDNHIRIP